MTWRFGSLQARLLLGRGLGLDRRIDRGACIAARGGATSIVGRDAELARLDAFLHDAGPGAALVLIGAPGVGKTTLWEAAIEVARLRGVRVLSARPGGSAAQLTFGGLIDLCD